jgi:hypothetical protein
MVHFMEMYLVGTSTTLCFPWAQIGYFWTLIFYIVLPEESGYSLCFAMFVL